MHNLQSEIAGRKRKRFAIPRKWLISSLFEPVFYAKSVKSPQIGRGGCAALCRLVPLGRKSGMGRQNSLSRQEAATGRQ